MINRYTITDFFSLSLVAYIARFLYIKFVFSTEAVQRFWYKREILFGVRNWSDRFMRGFYYELFNALESFTLVLIFMIAYPVMPSYGFFKVIIFFAFYEIITVPVKLRFSIILTNYPVSLLIFDILMISSVIFIQCSAIWFFYVNF